jgi:hypothetical protein
MMNKLRALMLAGALAALAFAVAAPVEAQVPGGLWRFGTTGAYAPQVGNCVSILAMNSSGQTGTDSGTPCAPAYLTTAYTNAAATTYTAVLTLPVTAASTTNVGECDLTWEDSSSSGTATFGAGLSATPTDLWVTASSTIGAYSAPAYTVISNTTTAAVTTALAAASATTPYKTHLTFLLQNSGTAANTLTIYAQSNSASYTLTVEPGSFCAWLP